MTHHLSSAWMAVRRRMGSIFFYHGSNGWDGFSSGGIDQKVSVGLGGVPPWAFRHRSLLKTSLGSTLCRNSQSCHAGPSKPPKNKIAAVGSTKRLPWSHNDILRLVRGSRPLDFYFTRIGRIGRIGLWILCARQKPNKTPCG